ncbi:MAG TPA: cysteine--tRNA ligase [Gemmatimonadaceae bacterium]|jgi:cysteinyl-tRNA synthetase
MSDFRLYNTLTRSIETFEPEDGKTVRMYTCGPTVYKPAHLGNFRTFLFEDLLRRVIFLRGWLLAQVMNLTDVDDKIIKSASEQGLKITDVTAPVERTFNEDRHFLRIQDAEFYPKATDHIPEMIAIVKRLVERKLAYKADDGTVYFAIDKFKAYGKLSRLDTREVKAGARVLQDDYSKENAQDFALWKAAKPEDEATGAAWDSPWGRGRPGWHLECSAMAMKYLGETLDIHCGGIDLIFPHHEDEIAQSEGATGKPFSRFWCHGEFLLTDGSKMAKRLGNVATVQDLRDQGIPAAAFRHFVFSTHYRKQLNMSADALEASMEGVKRVGDFAQRLADAKSATPELEQVADDAEAAVVAALYDDLNAPIALGALFTFIRRANAELDRNGVDRRALERAREVFSKINSVLDVVPEAAGPDPELAQWVEGKLSARKDARARREFAQADAIRAEIEGRGIAIEDGPQGTKWKKLR